MISCSGGTKVAAVRILLYQRSDRQAGFHCRQTKHHQKYFFQNVEMTEGHIALFC